MYIIQVGMSKIRCTSCWHENNKSIITMMSLEWVNCLDRITLWPNHLKKKIVGYLRLLEDFTRTFRFYSYFTLYPQPWKPSIESHRMPRKNKQTNTSSTFYTMSFIFFLITDSWVKNKIKKGKHLFSFRPYPLPHLKKENEQKRETPLHTNPPPSPRNKSSEALLK